MAYDHVQVSVLIIRVCLDKFVFYRCCFGYLSNEKYDPRSSVISQKPKQATAVYSTPKEVYKTCHGEIESFQTQ